MQENCKDFSEYEVGCCLNCEDSYHGCLCYSCKCKKCYYYVPPDESDEYDEDGYEKGACEIAQQASYDAWKKREYWKGKNKIIGLPKSQKQLNEY